jgi:hypothetical protein
MSAARLRSNTRMPAAKGVERRRALSLLALLTFLSILGLKADSDIRHGYRQGTDRSIRHGYDVRTDNRVRRGYSVTTDRRIRQGYHEKTDRSIRHGYK